MIDKFFDLLTDAQKALVKVIEKGKNASEADAKKYNNAKEEDLLAVGEYLKSLDEVPEAVSEEIASWWADAIEMLGNVPRPDPDSIPAGMVSSTSVGLYLAAIETTPFLSGPQ